MVPSLFIISGWAAAIDVHFLLAVIASLAMPAHIFCVFIMDFDIFMSLDDIDLSLLIEPELIDPELDGAGLLICAEAPPARAIAATTAAIVLTYIVSLPSAP